MGGEWLDEAGGGAIYGFGLQINWQGGQRVGC